MTALEHQSTLDNAISFGTRSTFAASFASSQEIQSGTVFLCAYDSLFGPVLIAIYCDEPTNSYSAAFISAHGENAYSNITLSSKSAYYGAIKNLPSRFKNNDYAKAAAIAALRTFACMSTSVRAVLISAAQKAHGIADWDETNAGELAGSLTLMCGKPAGEISRYILDNGLLQPHSFSVLTIDVVFKDADDTIELNNELVYSLGQRLENLFDPSARYCPEPTEELYSPPEGDSHQNDDGPEATLIIKELVELQNRYTIALHDFVSEFLSPLRVRCLESSKDAGDPNHISIALVNEIFPPTVDEVMRINKLYLSALKAASPFGAFETLRASALTIPYFFKACMRHQSAMRDFVHHIRASYDKIFLVLPDRDREFYSIRYLEQLLMVGQHLAKVKVILSRLLKASTFLEERQSSLARQYLSTCVDTIDAFASKSTNQNNKFRHNRVITPSGKLLTEFTAGWPPPLRAGWSYRRIISINSAFLLSTPSKERQEHILVIFSDYFLILKPRVPSKKVIRPSIADRLMYSLSNETFIKDIPNLDVVGYADVGDVVPSEFGTGSHNLSLSFTGQGFITNSGPAKSVTMRKLNYQMDANSGTRASQMIEYFVKSKIVKKTHAFHLFRWKHKAIDLYATVQEINAYRDDQTRTPVAIFLNTEISTDELALYGIEGAIKVKTLDNSKLSIEMISHFGIDGSRIISRDNFDDELFASVSEMVVACSSTENPKEVHHIIGANEAVLSNVIRYGMEASPKGTVVNQNPVKKAIASKSNRSSLDRGNSLNKNERESTTLFARRSSTASSFLHRLLSTKSSGFRKNRGSQLFQQDGTSKVTSPRSSIENNKRPRSSLSERRKSEESILSFKRNSQYGVLKPKPSTILEQETENDGKQASRNERPIQSMVYAQDDQKLKSIRQVSDDDSNHTPGLEESNGTRSPTIRQYSSSISDMNNSAPVSSETRHFDDVLNHPIIKREEENTELMLYPDMDMRRTDALGITVDEKDKENYNAVVHELHEMPSSPILGARKSTDSGMDTPKYMTPMHNMPGSPDNFDDQSDEKKAADKDSIPREDPKHSEHESKDVSFAYLADYLNGRASLECDKDFVSQYIASNAATNVGVRSRPPKLPHDRSLATLYLRDESFGYLAPYIDGSPEDTEHEFYSATATPVLDGNFDPDEQQAEYDTNTKVNNDESNWSEISHSQTVSIGSHDTDDVFEDASSFVTNEPDHHEENDDIPPQRPARSLSQIPSAYRISLRQLSVDIPFAESIVLNGQNWLIDEETKNLSEEDRKVIRTRSDLCRQSLSDNSLTQPTKSRSLGQLSNVDLSRPSALSALVENASSSSLRSTMIQDKGRQGSPLKNSEVARASSQKDSVRGLADRALHFFDEDEPEHHHGLNQNCQIHPDEQNKRTASNSDMTADSSTSSAPSLRSSISVSEPHGTNYESENVKPFSEAGPASSSGSTRISSISSTQEEPESSVTEDGIVIKRPKYPQNSIRAVSGGPLKVSTPSNNTALHTTTIKARTASGDTVTSAKVSSSGGIKNPVGAPPSGGGIKVPKLRGAAPVNSKGGKISAAPGGLERKTSNPFKGVSKFFSKIKNDIQKI